MKIKIGETSIFTDFRKLNIKNGKIRVKYRVKKNRPEEILIATCDQNSCSKKLN